MGIVIGVLVVIGAVVVLDFFFDLIPPIRSIGQAAADRRVASAPDAATPTTRQAVARALTIDSEGPGRSLGELALTDDALVVARGGGELRIPLRAITASSHDAGRLRLTWRAGERADGLTCEVDDADAWARALAPGSP